MRILVFSWRDPRHPLAGGAEQVMHEHMKGWVEAGHEVTLFASRFKDSKKNEKIDGVKVARGGYQYLGVQVAGFVYYLRNRKEVDFVVDQFHGLPFLTPLYCRKPKLAVIQEPATKVWFLNPLPKPLNWIVAIIGYIGEPFIFLFYRRVKFMTGSESAKGDVSKWGIKKEKIQVVPHGVIVKKPKPMPKREKKKTVVFLGVHSKDKGIEDALKCFSLLKGRGEFNFWTMGKFETEDYKKRLMRMVDKLGLKGKIKFWGFVSPEKKFELLAMAHVLVNPSAHEGWGLVNIEANAMGIPVVAYKSAGLVDSVKEGASGVFCEKNSPSAMADAVFSLLNDRKKYNKLQKGAVRWSKNFSWKRSKKMSRQLIEDDWKKGGDGGRKQRIKKRECEYFDSYSKNIDIGRINIEKSFNAMSREGRIILNALPRSSRDKRILDVGCGNGKSAVYLAKRGIEVIGIDISSGLINVARKLARFHKVENKAKFRVGDVEKLSFKNNYFDCVLAKAVLHHVDYQKAINEIFRVLKPGGVFIMSDPLKYSPLVWLYDRFGQQDLRSSDERRLGVGEIGGLRRRFKKVEWYGTDVSSLMLFGIYYCYLKMKNKKVPQYWHELIQEGEAVQWAYYVCNLIDGWIPKRLQVIGWRLVVVCEK